MTETIRSFLAVELPPEVKGALAGAADDLGRANLLGLRLVRPESIHLTLKFLGDTSAALVPSIVESVARVAGAHSSFALALGRAGAFPNRSSPRVLWIGIEGELAPLVALQQQIEEALAQFGFAGEGRGFSPHLTVARIRDGTSKADRQRAAEALITSRIPSGLSIEVRSISLMRSTLLPDGAVYERVACMPLKSGFRNSIGD